jgi:hypothetical protein
MANITDDVMQCKDIDDRMFLTAVVTAAVYKDLGSNRWELAKLLDLPMPLVLAKAAGLIRRGLLDGCTCGCRGDFLLTEKGKAF